MNETENLDSWLPVAEAAAAANVPLKTVYNWVASKRLVSRREGHRTLVPLAEVQRLAAARDAATGAQLAGTGAGSPAENGSMAGTVALARSRGAPIPALPGGEAVLAPIAFGMFDEGLGPLELVREAQAAPEVALKLHQQWRALRDASGSQDRRTTGERLEALERQRTSDREEHEKALSALRAEVEALQSAFKMSLSEKTNRLDQLGIEIGSLRLGLDGHDDVLRGLPVPTRNRYLCPQCKAQGLVTAQIRCTGCGHEHWWGFFPPGS